VICANETAATNTGQTAAATTHTQKLRENIEIAPPQAETFFAAAFGFRASTNYEPKTAI
jgi:hypothetical protein